MSEHLLRMSTLGKSSSQHCFRRPHQTKGQQSCWLKSRSAPKTQNLCHTGRVMTSARKYFFTCCASFIALFAITLLSGCQGVGVTGGPTPTPTPVTTPVATLQNVNHIIFMMQENRSFDAYFGKINDYRATFPGG